MWKRDLESGGESEAMAEEGASWSEKRVRGKEEKGNGAGLQRLGEGWRL